MREVLIPHQERFLAAIYARFVDLSRQHGVPAYWIYMPRVVQEQSAELQLRLAQEAGFRILNLTGAYDGHDPKSLEVAPWDNHPNALAHRLIADKLFDVLKDDKLFEVLKDNEKIIPVEPARIRTVRE